MATIYANNAAGYLAQGVGPSEGQLILADGGGAAFPSPSAGQWFWATLIDPETLQLEIVQCTSRSGDTLTVERGRDGTSAAPFEAGALVECRVTAALLWELQWAETANAAGGVLLLDVNARVPTNKLPSNLVYTTGGKINADVLPSSVATNGSVDTKVNALSAATVKKAGDQISGIMRHFVGNEDAAQDFFQFGWSNEVKRWALRIAASGQLELYSYNSSGASAVKVLGINSTSVGGSVELTVGNNKVFHAGNFNPDTKANVSGPTLSNPHLTGTVYFGAANTYNIQITSSEFRFTHAARGPNFIGTSDPSLKRKMRAAKINKHLGDEVHAITYEWRRSLVGPGYPKGRRFGVDASQVERVAPQHVYTSDDGTKGVDHAQLALEVALANAQRIRDLEEQVRRLLARVE